MPYGRMHEFIPMHPSKTAYRTVGTGAFDDVIIREFATRLAMLRAIEKQEREYDRMHVLSHNRRNWKPYIEEVQP